MKIIKDAIELVDSYIDPIDNDVIKALNIVKSAMKQKDSLLEELTENVIEDDPDDGPRCFFCWGEVDIYRNVYHDITCPVIRVSQILKDGE